MTDIVEVLRAAENAMRWDGIGKAINEIERLRELLAITTSAMEAVATAIENRDAEIERLRGVIDRAANAWLTLDPQVVWEGDVGDAMKAGVKEIERLRGLLREVMWHVKDEWRLDPQEGANVLVFDARHWRTRVREVLGDD